MKSKASLISTTASMENLLSTSKKTFILSLILITSIILIYSLLRVKTETKKHISSEKTIPIVSAYKAFDWR